MKRIRVRNNLGWGGWGRWSQTTTKYICKTFWVIFKESGDIGGIKIKLKKTTITTTKKRKRTLNTKKERRKRKKEEEKKEITTTKLYKQIKRIYIYLSRETDRQRQIQRERQDGPPFSKISLLGGQQVQKLALVG